MKINFCCSLDQARGTLKLLGTGHLRKRRAGSKNLYLNEPRSVYTYAGTCPCRHHGEIFDFFAMIVIQKTFSKKTETEKKWKRKRKKKRK